MKTNFFASLNIYLLDIFLSSRSTKRFAGMVWEGCQPIVNKPEGRATRDRQNATRFPPAVPVCNFYPSLGIYTVALHCLQRRLLWSIISTAARVASTGCTSRSLPNTGSTDFAVLPPSACGCQCGDSFPSWRPAQGAEPAGGDGGSGPRNESNTRLLGGFDAHTRLSVATVTRHKEFLDIAEAQAEPMVQPDAMTDEQVVVAGSFNYTGPANRLNDENIIILGDLESNNQASIAAQKKLAAYALKELDRIRTAYAEGIH